MPPASTPEFCPTAVGLDDLANLRAGLYGDDFELTLGALGLPPHVEGEIVLVDPEGVPLAAATAATEGERPRLSGLTWLGEPSSRPFGEYLVQGGRRLPAGTVVVVEQITGHGDLQRLQANRVSTVLALASPSLDGAAIENDIARGARSLAHQLNAPLVIAPLSRQDPDRDRKRAQILHSLGVQDIFEVHGEGEPLAPQAPGGTGTVLFFTGFSGSGKSTVARAVAVDLIERGVPVTLLDGDRVRRHLSAGLGFSAADRDTNIRRIGWVAAEIAHHGGVAICSPIAPKDEVRVEVATMVTSRGGEFRLIHVSTPLAECERRDRKGLYARARRGEIPDFTGISAPYDVPAHPDLALDTTDRALDECRDEVLALLEPRLR